MSLSDKNAQIKINNLEIQIINYYPNVHDRKIVCNKHVLNMYETNRVKYLDGFYMYTMQKTKESHGILIFKKTEYDGTVKLCIFDPNGKNNINDGYNLQIDETKYIVSHEMSPSKVWNDHYGHCAIWCLIFIILWNSFNQSSRNLFDKKISGKDNYNYRREFIDDIYRFIVNGKSFDTRDETEKFIEYVYSRILNIINS